MARELKPIPLAWLVRNAGVLCRLTRAPAVEVHGLPYLFVISPGT